MNESQEIKEIFLSKIGSSWLYDTLYLFIIVPMGILGTILNTISLCIFSKKDLRALSFFKYFQVYTLSSLILSFTLSFSFYLSPRYLFNVSTSYSARIFKCQITPSYIIALFLFYNNAISVLLNIERASTFTENFKKFKNMSPYSACLYLLVLCAMINLPTHFLIDVASDSEVYSALKSFENVKRFKGICLRNKNSLSSFGITATLFGFVVKGLLTLVLDIISNVLSIVYFKRYLKRKITSLQIRDLQTVSASVSHTAAQNFQLERIESMKRKQTTMTIYLTLFSIIVFAAELAANVIIYFFYKNLNVLFAFEFLIVFLTAFKQNMNFVFFYVFNTNFQRFFKNLFKRSSLSNL